MCLRAREGEGDRLRDQQRLRGASESEMRPEFDQRRLRADRQIPLSLDLMRRNSEPTEDRKKTSPGPVGCLVAVSVMDLLPALGSTVLASTVSRLRESAAVQSINRRLRRR